MMKLNRGNLTFVCDRVILRLAAMLSAYTVNAARIRSCHDKVEKTVGQAFSISTT